MEKNVSKILTTLMKREREHSEEQSETNRGLET